MERAPYTAVQGLAAIAAANWALIDGDALRHGVDLNALPLPRWLSAVYSWAVDTYSSIGNDKRRAARFRELERMHDWNVAHPETKGTSAKDAATQRAMLGHAPAQLPAPPPGHKGPWNPFLRPAGGAQGPHNGDQRADPGTHPPSGGADR